MNLEDKIYFIDDILDEYEKKGGDREAAEALYWTTRDELVDHISNNDGVVYKLNHFGTLYYTAASLNNLLKQVTRVIDKKSKFQNTWVNRKKVLESKLKNISSLIDKAKNNNVNNIWFFRKRFNPQKIKNG